MIACHRCGSHMVFPIEHGDLDCLNCGTIITPPRVEAVDRLIEAVEERELRDRLPGQMIGKNRIRRN